LEAVTSHWSTDLLQPSRAKVGAADRPSLRSVFLCRFPYLSFHWFVKDDEKEDEPRKERKPTKEKEELCDSSCPFFLGLPPSVFLLMLTVFLLNH
jgi:hypothetical protein